MSKKKFTIVFAALLSLLMASTAFAGTWEPSNGSWKYKNDDGTYVIANWVNDNGTWFYLDGTGFMKTGWFQDGNGAWYYFDPSNGAMIAGTTRNIEGTDYTFDANGVWLDPAAQNPQPTPGPDPGAQKPSADNGTTGGQWNGSTYVNRVMDYQVTAPSDYAITTDMNVGIDGAEIEFMITSPDNVIGIGFIVYDMPAIAEYDISAMQMAQNMQQIYGGGTISEAVFNDCTFVKMPSFGARAGIDLYFRRVGNNMAMIEVISLDPSRVSEADAVLSTIRRPQG